MCVQNHLESDVNKHLQFVADLSKQLHVLFYNARWFSYRSRTVLNSPEVNVDKDTEKYSHLRLCVNIITHENRASMLNLGMGDYR